MKTLTLLALASAALALAACQPPSASTPQPPIPPEGRPVQRAEKAFDVNPAQAEGGATITQVGANGECGLYRVNDQGRTFYLASRMGAGSCALMQYDPGKEPIFR